MFMRKRILRSSAILASSISSLVPQKALRAEESVNYAKKLRESSLGHSQPSAESAQSDPPALKPGGWKERIVTTTFWIGERPSPRNPVPNYASSWDVNWATNYGGTDEPDASKRARYIPATFTPKQNPFYVALPYNDLQKSGHKPEAPKVIPWFRSAYSGPGKSVLKGRWVAIRFGNRTCYAQWEDCGPFRTDHWQYVFGNERPKPNLNRGAGLDVSPAVRDYLGMADTDVTDWRFVEFEEVPTGPWSVLGENNTFVLQDRARGRKLVKADEKYGR
jgi:hypothetical protein